MWDGEERERLIERGNVERSTEKLKRFYWIYQWENIPDRSSIMSKGSSCETTQSILGSCKLSGRGRIEGVKLGGWVGK